MKYLLVCALAVVLSSSLNASAQDEGTTQKLQERRSERASEATALQLNLDAAGVAVMPGAPRTVDGYTLKQMEKRVQRAKRGLIGSSVFFGLGLTGTGIGLAALYTSDSLNLSGGVGALMAGAVGFAGMVGMAVAGGRWHARKRKLRTLREAEHGITHRLQWDVETSRLVF
ncbi:MAG: hypothetical protein WCF10_02085 [Polyangiales bacterium]